MNRIVLIGNGFDLAHGLPTRYEDFINDYWVRFINEAFTQRGGYEKECVNLQIRLSNYTLKYLLRGETLDNYIDLINNIRQYGTDARLTIANEIFKHLSALNELNWVDIENEYYRFLCYQFEEVKSDKYHKYEDVRKLNHDFEYVKNKLNDYLIKILDKAELQKYDKIWNVIYSPFLLREFTDEGKKDFVEAEFWKIKRRVEGTDDQFYKEMSSKTDALFEGYENTYIYMSDKILKDSLLNDMKDEELTQQYFDLKPEEVLFLNFNYTDTEKLYLDTENFDSEMIHIHGELTNPSNPIIFGYGDELEDNYKKLENLQDNNYLENIKSIKYLETDNYKRILDFINSDKYQIIILGHSCGNSDRTLLNTLFEHENCVSIKPYYYQYEENGVIKDNYSDIVRNISRCFTDKRSMRDKVVNKTYTDWFASSV